MLFLTIPKNTYHGVPEHACLPGNAFRLLPSRRFHPEMCQPRLSPKSVSPSVLPVSPLVLSGCLSLAFSSMERPFVSGFTESTTARMEIGKNHQPFESFLLFNHSISLFRFQKLHLSNTILSFATWLLFIYLFIDSKFVKVKGFAEKVLNCIN